MKYVGTGDVIPLCGPVDRVVIFSVELLED